MHRLNSIIIGGLALVLGLVAIFGVLGGGENEIAQISRYFAYAGLAIGLLWPRGAMFVLILSACYSDLLKRLLLFGGSFTGLDIAYPLAVTPLILGGIWVHIIFSWMVGSVRLSRFDIIAFTLTFGVMVSRSAVLLAKGAPFFGVVQSTTNSAAYLSLIPIINIFFSNRKDLKSLLIFAMICFVPVAAYGIFQHLNGFSKFEEDYLRSGYTITFSLLDEVIVRPFSTVSSPHALCLSAVAMVNLLFTVSILKTESRIGAFKNPFLIGSLVLFCGVIAVSFVRTGWACLFVMIIAGFVLFRNKGTTMAFYILSVIGFIVVIASADYLLDQNKMDRWTSDILDGAGVGERTAMAVRLTTFTARLHGFRNLASNPDMWLPFGLVGKELAAADYANEFFSHDAFSSALVTYGYIPLGVALVVGIILLYKLHRDILRNPNPISRKIAIMGIALVAGFIITNASSRAGANLSTFPANVFFSLSLAIVATSTYGRLREHLQRESSSESLKKGIITEERGALPI